MSDIVANETSIMRLVPGKTGQLLQADIHAIDNSSKYSEVSTQWQTFAYVLHGKVELIVDEQVDVINEGDSFYLEAATSFQCRPVQDSAARLLVVKTPPQ